MSEPQSPFKRVRRTFDRVALKRVCEMRETDFPAAYGMDTVITPPQSKWADDETWPDFYAYLDRGSNILAVAHLDTVVKHAQRECNFLDTAAGPVVYSGALDDRLGAYTILELLPALGINVDVLLTTGEETADSTAQFFEASKEYNWMIEFDRGGTDVVMYQYEDHGSVDLVEEHTELRVGSGSFSDIAYLEQLEVKGFNWGVGYQDYHGPRSHAYLEDYWMTLGNFVKFHDVCQDMYLPHEDVGYRRRRGSSYQSYGGLWGSDVRRCDQCGDYGVRDDYCLLCGEVVDLGDVIDAEGEVISDDYSVVNRHLLELEQGN